MPPKRRGKFLNTAPSPSASSNPTPPTSQTRGKFLGGNTKKTGPSSSSSGGGGGDVTSGSGGGEHHHIDNNGGGSTSLDNLKDHVCNTKTAASARRKAIASQRQSVLNDLNEAENIVLSLLQSASEVAGSLSEMTSAKSKQSSGSNGKKGVDDDEEGGKSFEELTANIRSNGVGYLAGVKKLHALLAPHSSLVKSYKNMTGEGEESADSTTDGISSHHKSLAASVAGGSINSSEASKKIVEDATSNLYAIRVKKRLAIEKSDILKEMIRLQELEDGEDCSDGVANGDYANNKEDTTTSGSTSTKRKRPE